MRLPFVEDYINVPEKQGPQATDAVTSIANYLSGPMGVGKRIFIYATAAVVFVAVTYVLVKIWKALGERSRKLL